MDLEVFALRWLLYQKRCVIALRERSPREWPCGKPDALGITAKRYLIEIEIKRSLSDFKADFKKPSRCQRDGPLFDGTVWKKKLPQQFYYLVPNSLVNRVVHLIPDWAGLMRGPQEGEPQAAYVVKQAPVNEDSQRLSVKECCRLVRMVANWAMSETEGHHNAWRRFREGTWPWPEPEYEI